MTSSPKDFNAKEHADFWIDQFKVATAAIEKATEMRRDAAARRYHSVQQLRSVGWSLQRIADELGISKTAVSKAGSIAETHVSDAALTTDDFPFDQETDRSRNYLFVIERMQHNGPTLRK